MCSEDAGTKTKGEYDVDSMPFRVQIQFQPDITYISFLDLYNISRLAHFMSKPFESYLTSLQQSLILQVLRDDHNRLLHACLLRVDVDFWILRCLVWRAYACELLDLTRFGLLIEALRVTLLSFFDRDVNEDFDEGKRCVGVLGVGMQITSNLAIGFVWRDEGGKGDRR
jgi:hypothetical protein